MLEDISDKMHRNYYNTLKYSLANGDKIHKLDVQLIIYPNL